jgi:hypothetical protein
MDETGSESCPEEEFQINYVQPLDHCSVTDERETYNCYACIAQNT